MRRFICTACDATFDHYVLDCPECRGLGAVRAVSVGRTAASLEPSPSGLTSIDLNVKEPDRVSLGLATLDRAFGLNADGRGGFVLGSIVTLAGEPGAGKSTCGMLVGEAFQRRGLSVIYAASESTLAMFSLMAKRTGIGKRLDLLFTRDVSEILREAEVNRPGLLIVDSLHSLDPRADSLPHARRLADFVNAHGMSLLVIGERSKNGTTRGDWGVEYQGEVTVGLEKLVPSPTDPPDPLVSQRRWVVVAKNRHGGTGSYPLLLTDCGWAEANAG